MEAVLNEVRSDGPQGPRRSVLLVDDEDALVELLVANLEVLGHRVTGFTDAEKALSEFCSRPQDFDAVVSDLSMPRMSGLELARRVLEIRPGAPIILMSGYVRTVDEAAAKAMGIRGFAFKGTSTEKIAQALDRILRGEEGPEASLYAEPT